MTVNLKKSIFSFLFSHQPGFGWKRIPQLCRSLRSQGCQTGHCVAKKFGKFVGMFGQQKMKLNFFEKLATLKIWPFFGHFLYFLPKEWFWPIPKFGQFDLISRFLDKIRKWSFTKTSLFFFLATLYSLIHINFKNYTFKKKVIFDITDETL